MKTIKKILKYLFNFYTIHRRFVKIKKITKANFKQKEKFVMDFESNFKVKVERIKTIMDRLDEIDRNKNGVKNKDIREIVAKLNQIDSRLPYYLKK